MRILQKYLKPNHAKISSYKQRGLKNWKKLIHFLILQKHINRTKNFFPTIGYPDSQDNRQVKIG